MLNTESSNGGESLMAAMDAVHRLGVHFKNDQEYTQGWVLVGHPGRIGRTSGIVGDLSKEG